MESTMPKLIEPATSLSVYQEMIDSGDTSIFRVHSDSSLGDRKSLLAIQSIVRRANPRYVYLEIGSYLGGTIYPHLVDFRCHFVYSIDKRPPSQPDERGRSFDYLSCTTARMIETLQPYLSQGELLKLHTVDADASELTLGQIAFPCDLAFIDGEHTNQAVFRDFMSIRRFVKDNSIIAFHDAYYIGDALTNIETFLTYSDIKYQSFVLADCVFVVLLGEMVDFVSNALARLALDKNVFFERAKKSLWREIAKNNETE